MRFKFDNIINDKLNNIQLDGPASLSRVLPDSYSKIIFQYHLLELGYYLLYFSYILLHFLIDILKLVYALRLSL